MKRILRLIAVLALTIGCGGGQTHTNLFSEDWSNDQGRSAARVRQKLQGTKPPPGADIALGIAGNGDKLIGLPLGGGAKWTFAHKLDARPTIAGDLVIGVGDGELFALDAESGRKIWGRSTGGLPVIGAGDDGTVTVVTLARSNGSTVLAVARDGTVAHQVETDKVLGVPAVLGGLAFIPWAGQYVSVFDLTHGDESARILFREKVSHAWSEGGNLYFGEVGIFRFDDHIRDASRAQATHVALPARELPGTPVLMVPPEERQATTASARDRIRLYARPSPGDGPLGIDTDRFYATYFRLVMGFDALKGNLAWVHTDPDEIVGGAAGVGSLVTCDSRGKITMLDAHDGTVVLEHDLGDEVRSCVVHVDGLKTPAGARTSRPLAEQIAAALTDGDAQLATAKRVLLREMAAMQDEIATKVLVDLATDPRTGPPLDTDAKSALAGRRTGAKYMLPALARHYDYLKDVLRPPPIGPLARALSAMKDKSASALLASHLLDPANADGDVQQVAEALEALGDESQVPAMKQFFVLYHAAADGDPIEAAVVIVARGLMKMGGKDGRALIDRALRDPMTSEAVKGKLQGLVNGARPKAAGTISGDGGDK